MTETWLLLIDPKLSATDNMAIDSANLIRAARKDFPPVLRFFDWENPSISMGYNQSIEEIDEEKCREDGVDIVTRPTGGRAVLHWNEITYSLVIPVGHNLAEKSIIESYKQISEALIIGFRKIGIDAELARGEAGGHRLPSCFSSTSRFEITANGLKIVGSAQRRKSGAFLQQGSIPLTPEYRNLIDYVRGIRRQRIYDSVKSTCLSEILDDIPERESVIQALIYGFKSRMHMDFKAAYHPDIQAIC